MLRQLEILKKIHSKLLIAHNEYQFSILQSTPLQRIKIHCEHVTSALMGIQIKANSSTQVILMTLSIQ